MPRERYFSCVTATGFVGYRTELDKAPWAEIPAPDPLQPLSQAPTLVGLKRRVVRAVDAVLGEKGLLDTKLRADEKWDLSQKRLRRRVALDELHKQPELRAAAGRVRAALLSKRGTAQNKLAHDHEVDHGYAQVNLCAEGAPLHGDIQLLGYQTLIDDIRVDTEELSLAVRHEVTGARRPARSLRIRKAVRAAARVFDEVLHHLDELADEGAPGSAEHRHLQRLRLSLQNLQERYAAVPAPEPKPRRKRSTSKGAAPEAPAPLPAATPSSSEPGLPLAGQLRGGLTQAYEGTGSGSSKIDKTQK